MSSAGAVFLSYASQDAAAAWRLCEALRAAGLEVWFDQSELRGGDTWDRKIRAQIRDCALFLPVISANTQARLEGYFRLEWKLAEDRSHLMAKGKPFIVPVVVDGTTEREAHVPDAFLAVQWTRLPDGEATAAFFEQVQRLLGGPVVAGVADPGPASARPATKRAEGAASPIIPQPRRVPPLAWLGALAAVAAFAGYFFFYRSTPPTSGPSPIASSQSPVAAQGADKSLVVLPLEPLSRDPENVAFAEQLHAEIIETLQLIPELRVVSRATALAAKAEAARPAEIAKKLGVEVVLSGNVRREKSIIRIHLELRRGRDDALLWSLPKRDRDAGNQLALQTEIAEQIARVLQARETKGGAAAVARFMTRNPRAYDLFVKMRKLIDEGTRNWAEIAAQCEVILALDPDFMEAAMLLSASRSILAARPGTAPTERLSQATEAKRWAEAAARMVPGGAGDGALVRYYLQIERDGLRALAFAENLVRAMPNAADSHYQVARALQDLGRISEAVVELQRAVGLDPSSAVYERNLSSRLAALRRLEESHQAGARAVAKGLSSTDAFITSARFIATGELPAFAEGASRENLVLWLWRGRRWAEAQTVIDAELRNAQTNDVQRWALLCARADVCARLEQPAEAATAARDALATAERLQSVSEVGPTEKPGWLAAALVRVGRTDEAIAAAKRAVAAAPAESHTRLRWEREIELAKIYAYANRPRECIELLAKLLRLPSSITVPMLKVEPDWDNVREDLAFKALLDDPKNSAPL